MLPGVVAIAVIAYLLLGWAIVADVAREARRDPVSRAEWEQVRQPMWQMVTFWPAIYGALAAGAIRKFRKRHTR